ncbi:DUF3530 family protein [Marinobacter sp.]|uniref:DUF3530 family protein n=1 Tax=Marinobacter sp. TaxID=50741 RepID=UPI0034A2F4EA
MSNLNNRYTRRVFFLGWLILTLTLGLAGAAVGEEEAETVATPAQKQRAVVSSGLGSDVIAAQRPDTAIWLDLEGDGAELALFEPELEAPAKGAVLMLADEGQSAASELLGALGEPFAANGWGVMTLGLEAPPYELQRAWRLADARRPERQEDESQDPSSVMIDVMEDGELEDAEDQYRTRIQDRLSAAATNLQERGYERIVLVGVGAAAMHVARSAAAGTGDQLIWVAPRFYPADESALGELLASVGALPVLDMHSARPQVASLSPRKRAARLKKAGAQGYQLQLVGTGVRPEPREAAMLANRIQSWLRSI